jgi:cytochrome c biogenesis protein CcdA/glutaredoxin
MRVHMNKILMLALLSLLLFTDVYAAENEEADIYMFYAVGCPYCARMESFLDNLLENETRITVQKYEINQNINLFFELAEKYNLDVGESVRVPVLFMHEKVFVGFNDEIGEQIKEYLPRCVELCTIAGEGSDITHTIGKGDIFEPESKLKKLTLPAVISAAAVDAINPCAFAVLILLLSTIALHKSKKKALFAGLAFTLAIFISYLLMGIGLYSALKISGFTHIFYYIVAGLAVLVGLFNLKDYLWYGKWFVMEVPLSWRPKMKMLVKSVVSVPGAFLIGFAVSLFLLPCTSGPYIIILGLLAQATTRNYAFMLLILYNLIFVLPMLIITLAIYFGFTTTEKAEQWRTKKLKVLHLIAGIIILLLGIGMFVAILLGYV